MQICRVIRSLSPVRILTSTPDSASARTASAASASADRRSAKPAKVSLSSSLSLIVSAGPHGTPHRERDSPLRPAPRTAPAVSSNRAVEGHFGSVRQIRNRARQDLLGRTLHHEQPCRAIVEQHRNAATLEIEGDLVELLPSSGIELFMPRMASSSGLLMPLSKALFREASLSTRGCLCRLDRYGGELITQLGQGSGLVGAEDVHGAQIVDRGKALDDDAARRKAPRPLASVTVTTIGRSSASGRRQAQARRGEIEQGPVKHHIGDRDEQHEKDRQPQHQESELANASLEGVPRPFHGEPMASPPARWRARCARRGLWRCR